MAIGNFGKEYGKLLNEIIERQFLRDSVYVLVRDAKRHQALLDKGWDEVSGDEVGGWVMRRDVPAGSEAKGAS